MIAYAARLLRFSLLISTLASPLAAEPQSSCPAGPVERRVLGNGCLCLLQPTPVLPVVAVTLAHGWGRADAPPEQPGMIEFLNKLVNRSTEEFPSGALLLQTAERGGTLSFSTGEHWSEYTLIVPRSQLEWAVSVQLQRLDGPFLKNSDWQSLPGFPAGADLAGFVAQHWPQRPSVLSITGGFEPQSLQKLLPAAPTGTKPAGPALSASPCVLRGEAPPPLRDLPPPGLYRAGRVAWRLPLPATPRAQAAARIWQAQLREQDLGVELDLDPVEQGAWLSTSCSGLQRLESARTALGQALQESSRVPSPRARHRALLSYLKQWDDVGSRARMLALQPELPARAILDTLRSYDGKTWTSDMSWVTRASATEARYQAPSEPAVSGWPTHPTGSTPPAPFSPAAPASVPFARLEFSPHCTALVQAVPGTPLIAIKAMIPGGSALDAPSQAGRAEWLGATWRECLDGDYPTEVETGVQHWIVSTELPASELPGWTGRFLQTLGKPQFTAEQLSRAQRRLLRWHPGPLQLAYQRWLKQLFPPEHPWGREGELADQMEKLTPLRVTELAEQVSRMGFWNLFVSGDVAAQDVQSAVTQAGGAHEGPAIPGLDAPLSALAEPLSTPVSLQASVDRATLLLGGLGPARKDRDYYAFVVLLQVLAGDPLRSRLQLELRQKEPLAQRVDCSFLSANSPAPWLVRVDCDPSQLEAVQGRLREQLQKLSTSEISPQELRRAVSGLEGNQQLAAGSASGRVAQLRNLELFRLADNYTEGFAGIYRSVTAKDVLQAAQLRLQQKLATVVVLPEKSAP